MVKSSDAAESHDESKTKSSFHLEYVVREVFKCYICKSEYDTNQKQQKHVNENQKDLVKIRSLYASIVARIVGIIV